MRLGRGISVASLLVLALSLAGGCYRPTSSGSSSIAPAIPPTGNVLPPSTAPMTLIPDQGPAGTLVRIKTAGLHPQARFNAVFFGTARSRVLDGEAGEIRVLVPAGATSGPVRVNQTIGASFNVTPGDAPPRLRGAGFLDMDLNARPTPGDRIIIRFSEVVIQGVTPNGMLLQPGVAGGPQAVAGAPTAQPAPAIPRVGPPPQQGLDLPPSGAFGTGATTYFDGVGAIATLGLNPVLDVAGAHQRGSVGTGPTGIDVTTPNFFQDAAGQSASGGHALDVENLLEPVASISAAALAFGDVDGDRIADLLAEDRVLLRRGGYFVPAFLPVLPRPAVGLAALDFDGDGRLDLALAASDRERLLQGDGRGGFADVTALRLPALALGAQRIVAADLDRDGDLDLVSGRVLMNDAGAFREVAVLPQGAAVAAVDLDHDGDLDIVCGGPGGLQRLMQLAPGVFGAPVFVAAGAVTDLASLDVDGDGDQDLVVARATGLALLANGGAGTFTDISAGNLPGAIAATRVAVADIDGDGLRDLVTAGTQPRALLASAQVPRFTDASTNLPLGAAGASLSLADYDDDGDQDLWLGGTLSENTR